VVCDDEGERGLSPSTRLRRVSPRGLGDFSGKEKVALRLKTGPIRDPDVRRRSARCWGCRLWTMELTWIFCVRPPFDVLFPLRCTSRLTYLGQADFGEADASD
jgi:hypothetical protein